MAKVVKLATCAVGGSSMDAAEAAMLKIEWRCPTIFEEDRMVSEEELQVVGHWNDRKAQKAQHTAEIVGRFHTIQDAKQHFEMFHVASRARHNDPETRDLQWATQAIGGEAEELLEALQTEDPVVRRDRVIDEAGDLLYCSWLAEWI